MGSVPWSLVCTLSFPEIGSDTIMDASLNSNKVFLANLLLRLHSDEMTGVVTVKDNRRALKIYLKQGHVVYADGIDKDAQLLKEIASKRKLDPNRIKELQDLKEKDPQSLGKTLIEQKIISESVWGKFLQLKVKSILTAALEMETADLGFSQSKLNIPPVNFIDYNIVQLLLDTIRAVENPERLKRRIPDDDAVFSPSEEVDGLKAGIPLSPSEETIFSTIDGQKTVREVVETTRLSPENVYKGIYLLLCFGLIGLLPDEEKKGGGGTDYAEIIHLYLDILGIVEENFQKEVGKEFDNIFSKCRMELTGDSKDLFHDLTLSKDAQQAVVDVITTRFKEQGKTEEGRLILLSAFNKLIFLLIMRMKKVIGKGLAERTINEMMNILEYVEKYREDAELTNYVRGNLQDYLRQIKS
jgi:hypothetical protein